MTDDADQVVSKAGPVIDNANATVVNANQTITDLREPVQKDLADLSRTLDQARGLIVDFRASMRAKDQDQDFTYTPANIRAVTDNLTDSLKQRPWSLIRIRQPKDRKVPQTASAEP